MNIYEIITPKHKNLHTFLILIHYIMQMKKYNYDQKIQGNHIDIIILYYYTILQPAFLPKKGGVFLIPDEIKTIDEMERISVFTRTFPAIEYANHDFLELVYVTGGHARCTIDNQHHTLSKGDYFMIDYNQRRDYKQIGKAPFSIYSCIFTPKFIDSALHNSDHFEDVIKSFLINLNYEWLQNDPYRQIYHDDNGHILQLFSDMYEEYQNKELRYTEMIRYRIVIILIDIMRQVQYPKPADSNNQIVLHIVEHIQNHYTEKLSLQEIANRYNYSLAHISHIFKQELGVTFKEYLQFLRIQKSCYLLIHTTKNATDIANMVGYTDIKFFNQVFKRQKDMTPTQFRNKYALKSSE